MIRRSGPAWLALALTGLLAGCCSGPELALLALDPRSAIEARESFAVVAPRLAEEGPWAYASAAAVASDLAAHYRPTLPVAEAPAPPPEAVAPLAAAPAELQGALRAAIEALEELGYRRAPPDATEADFVVAIGITRDEGRPVRVGLHVGGLLDGRFRHDLVSVQARLPDDDPECAVDLAELVGDLVSVLPPRAEGPAK